MFDLNEVVRKSDFLQMVRNNDSAVVWHSLFGYPQIVSIETLKFIDSFSNPKTIQSVIGENPTSEELSVIEEIIRYHFLISENFDERALLESAMEKREMNIASGSFIDNLSLIISEECNFRCSYCIHFNNLRNSERMKNHKKFMRFETAKKAVDDFLGILRKNRKQNAEINFGGGESLLAWPVIERVVKYCINRFGPEFNFRFSINTNASLITFAIAEFLKKYRFEISSSLDGIGNVNDRVRQMRSGKGTFLKITKGFSVLSQVGYPITGFAVTITEINFQEINELIIDWAVEHEVKEVRIDIDVIGMVNIPIEEIVAKLMNIRRYAEERGIDVPGFWFRPAENLNESTLESSVAFCGAVRGNSMCVNPAGDIYGCGYSTIKLGELSEFGHFSEKDGSYYNFVKSRLTGSMKTCKGCMIEGQCAGGCNITQEFAVKEGNEKVIRMCDFYRRMTEKILLEQLHKVESHST